MAVIGPVDELQRERHVQFAQQAVQIGIVVYGVFLVADGAATMGSLIAAVIDWLPPLPSQGRLIFLAT